MPEISRFLGIVIFMNFNEHNPPHFHARYGDFEIIIGITDGMVEGKFPKRAMSLIWNGMKNIRVSLWITGIP